LVGAVAQTAHAASAEAKKLTTNDTANDLTFSFDIVQKLFLVANILP
jgi:hypothetical protein